jgi:hypothetical protein
MKLLQPNPRLPPQEAKWRIADQKRRLAFVAACIPVPNVADPRIIASAIAMAVARRRDLIASRIESLTPFQGALWLENVAEGIIHGGFLFTNPSELPAKELPKVVL